MVRKILQRLQARWKRPSADLQVPAQLPRQNPLREAEAADGPVYMNRELSWLRFNARVLEEAEDPEVPFCERLTFASIYQSNLDEFFMVRVGSLMEQRLLEEQTRDSKTQMTPQEQIDAILSQVQALSLRRDRNYDALMKELEEKGLRIVNFQRITEEEEKFLRSYFDAEVRPVISPTIVGKRQPFPFLKNKEIYAAVVLETKNKKRKLGIVPCSSAAFDRLIEMPLRKGVYILLEELILHYVSTVFEGYAVVSKSLIRVTRNADIDADALYDEELDYREFMAELVKRRRKLSPVRLELSRPMDNRIVGTLCQYLDLERSYVFRSHVPLDLSFVFQLEDVLRKQPELFYPKQNPVHSAAFDMNKPIIPQIRQSDKLLSYPYESMQPFLRLLHEAARDKNVLSIKISLYRVAKQSKVVEALMEAAENGKEVVVLVELKARFDEEANIEWSRQLERAGCRVIYGISGYKVHSKICLISYMNKGSLAYISQIGTGNYNEKTARLYTDYSLMTANPAIGQSLTSLFQALLKDEVLESAGWLLAAPKTLQSRVLSMMDTQIAKGSEGYIGLKLNSLTDKAIIDKLIEASCAGVRVDMVIRGICCLIPGVPGKTENIHIRSIVGRYLEHSRLYIFGSKDASVYLSSADFMTRNTLRRVEIGVPVLDGNLKAQLLRDFSLQLSDTAQARLEESDGTYRRLKTQMPGLNAQQELYRLAREGSIEARTTNNQKIEI